MNKTIYYIIFLFLTSLISCNNDDISSVQADSFLKLYGSWNVDIGNDIKPFNDGYVILATVTSADNEEKTAIALIQTDKFGNTITLDTLATEKGGSNTASKLLKSNDGGILILGTCEDTLNNNTDIYIQKRNADLAPEWEKTIGSASNETGGAIANATSGYIITGSTTKENLVNGNQEGNKDIILVKITETGDLEWENNFGGAGDDMGNDILVKGNKYLLLGTSNSFNEPGQAKNNIILIETNQQGNETDKLTYGGSFNDYGNAIIHTDDNGYILVGTSEIVSGNNTNLVMIKIENDIHEISWNQSYGTTLNDEGFDIIKSADGYIAVGSREQVSGKAAYFLSVDMDGNILAENIYGGYNNQTIHSIEATNDNGYIMTGSSAFDGNDMICLIKVNSKGEL